MAKYVQVAPKLIIRLEANGGSTGGVGAVYINNGAEIGVLPTPTWDGYIFTGWYTKAEGRQLVVPTTRMTESVAIFARWKVDPNYEIKIVESGSCGENATYTIDNVGTVIISGTGMLDQNVFRYRVDIKKVFIAEGITHIGSYEFHNCYCLVYVSLPSTIVSIGDSAFANCYKIANSFFETDSWRVIGQFAFYNCAIIEYIMLPDMIAVIGNGAFSYCLNLTIRCTKDSKGQHHAIINGVNWENFWKISFDANGGKVSENIKYPTNNTSIGTLPTPTRTNYAFKGWYTDKTNGIKVTSQTKATENMTLYARWEVVKPNTMLGFTYSERTSNSVTLKWTKNVSATGYFVQQYKNGGWSTVKKITANSTVSYKVAGLSASKTYQFKIVPYKMVDGVTVYGEAATKSVKTLPSYTKGFTYGARTAASVTLKWTKNTSEDGYVIQQYKSGGWTTIKTITTNSTVKYKVTSLKPSVNYKFRIKAYKMDGTTKVYGAYVSKKVMTTPSSVKSFTYKARTKTTITLKWAKNTSASGYVIQQYKGGKWTTIKTITKNSTVSYKVSNLKKNTSYKFRIKAYKTSSGSKIYGVNTTKTIKTLS